MEENNNQNNDNQNNKFKITTPIAIIIAGVLVMIGILATKSNISINSAQNGKQTLSSQVGVKKDKLVACIKETDWESFGTEIENSVEKAMKSVPEDQRGTPYSVIVGSNGAMTEVKGAYSEEKLKSLIDEVINNKVANPYKGEVPPVNEKDHLLGSNSALVTIIEYSDYECPYCKIFHETVKKVVNESNGQVAWVYRHWPLHKNSFEKLANAECVAKIKGNEAFWQYSDLLFSLLKTSEDSISDEL